MSAPKFDFHFQISGSLPVQSPLPPPSPADPMGAPQLLPFPVPDQPPQPATSAAQPAAPGPSLWDVWRVIAAEKRLARRSDSTLAEHETAIRKIEAACLELTKRPPDSRKVYRTMNPVVFSSPPRVEEFTRESIHALVQAWVDEGLSRDTIRKRRSTLKMLLQDCVDRDLLHKLPKFPAIPSGATLWGFAGTVEIDEVDALYRAADALDWPRIGTRRLRERVHWLPPSVWWRTWLVLWWCYGLRTQDVVAIKRGPDGLLWDEVKDAPLCPVPGVKVENPHGWLFVVPNKTARTKGQPVIAPIHPVVRRHLALFRGLDRFVSESDARRVFPNGRATRQFYAGWRRLLKTAGVGDDATVSGGRTGGAKRSIRKSCANNWPGGLGEWITGHANLGVHAAHYKSVAGDLVAALADLPLPESFRDESLLPKRQLDLPG